MATEWTVEPQEGGLALTAFLRLHVERSLKQIKGMVRDGQLQLDGVVVRDPGLRLQAGQRVSVGGQRAKESSELQIRVCHLDAHVAVIEKPCGISTVPYDDQEENTALHQLSRQLRREERNNLYVVHRIDKDTSGLVMFARTYLAKRVLQAQLRVHSAERTYVCIAHGAVPRRTIASRLVSDRGDGLRGSTTSATLGKHAVTHVVEVQTYGSISRCVLRLETGRTHQIRVHLAESGHPLVGERVYIRDYVRRGLVPVEATRLMLHAASLGFDHPHLGHLQFESAIPEAFAACLLANSTGKTS